LEAVDEKINPTFKDFIKSKLFFVPTVDHIFRIIYLLILISFFAISANQGFSEVNTIFLWGAALLIINAGMLTIYWTKLKKQVSFKFPISLLIKYFVVGVASSIPTFLLMDQFLEYHESIFDFFPNLIPFLILQIGIYLIITILWDKETKNFVLSILREIRR